MTNTNISQFRADIFNQVNRVLDANDVINISTKKGDVVMLSASEYNDIMETLHLLSIPGMKEKLEEGLNTPDEECEPFDWRKELK